jgi:hypothetical protein
MKERNYRIETRPTEPVYQDGELVAWRTAYGLSRQVADVQTRTVACTSYEQLDIEVNEAARENPAEHVQVRVTVDGRKPAGFDARYDNIRPRSKETA